MARDILYNEEARAKLQAGVNKVANAVKITLGARGRNVILDKGFGYPVITKDGVSVARDIELKDRFENIGASLIKGVASKTNDNAGDGTTTATVLAQALINSGLKYVAMGINPLEIKKGMDTATEQAVGALKLRSKPVKDSIASIASISANDEKIGALIADAMKEVGTSGVITVEDGTTNSLEVEIVKGMKFDNGYLSPYMVTNQEKGVCEIFDPYILVTDAQITMAGEIMPIVQKLAEAGIKNLVVIAKNINGEALTALIVNKLKGAFNSLAVQAPHASAMQDEVLKDIASLTGATLVSDTAGMKLSDVEISHLGRAMKVVADAHTTTIVEGRGDVTERIAYINEAKKIATSQFDKERLQERIAKLSGGVAVIKVGAASEVEIKEIKDRIEDAINATKAAIEEGVVIGGGIALLQIIDEIEEDSIGGKIVKESLELPFRQIVYNAGDSADVLIVKIREQNYQVGYNAKTGQLEDLLKVGILDPVKVTRSALENANSIASMLLTTEAIITEEDGKEQNN